MKSLSEICRQLAAGQIDLTQHAATRIVERNISKQEIQDAGKEATIIEDYPDDKYAPSCLLLGFTKQQRPLHIHVSRMNAKYVRIITLYEPEETEWIDFSTRR